VEERSTTVSGYVFDLLGNSSVWFEQFDGTTSLPFKSNGRFHLGGKVTVTPPDVFRKLVDNVIPILKAKGNKPCVIIPPVPRCLFSRCCSDTSHCTNADDNNFAETMVAGFLRQRTDMIRQLVQSGLNNFKVLDSCCMTNCAATASIPERTAALKKTTWSDGIHHTTDGYRYLAERTAACLKTLMDCPKTKTKKGDLLLAGIPKPEWVHNAKAPISAHSNQQRTEPSCAPQGTDEGRIQWSLACIPSI
jgi:hypothetical protein